MAVDLYVADKMAATVADTGAGAGNADKEEDKDGNQAAKTDVFGH